MKNYNLSPAVEQAAKKLLDHFQSQYGSLIFIPLGVGSWTPAKIAPKIAENISDNILVEEEKKLKILLKEERVGLVFDAFINNFFDSLNFIAKGIMKALGMKMLWADFSRELAENKTKNPATYEKWKKNLTLVLEGVFTEVSNILKEQGNMVEITDGNQIFTTVEEAIAHLEIFQ